MEAKAFNVKKIENIKIKTFEINFSIEKFVDYTCNGYELTYQPIDLGSYNIPYYDKVKAIEVYFDGYADDEFRIDINNIIFQWNYYNDKLGITEDDFAIYKSMKIKNIKLSNNNIKIKGGAINLFEFKCGIKKANILIKFLYQN
ncbi:hypothetical protein IO405_001293 [Campylobacter lari]|nr:hypothetical protein [Campylobacter lari]